ncbi:MAG: MBL fold metallo-hydrolase RNA specificity domain-containing protein [Phycisphaerales bacterium]
MGEVTGSSTLLETGRARVLIDFGLFQGGPGQDAKNRRRHDFSRLDAVVLTHAHVDHSGRLPLLSSYGYTGPIWCTPETIDLCRVMLRDSAQVQEADAREDTRRNLRRGKEPVEPLYTKAEAEQVLGTFKPVRYGTPTEVAPGVRVRLVDAGHILGSASVEVTIEEGGGTKTIVFSGDIGVSNVPINHNPERFEHADLVVMESTYGDRDHRSREATVEEFRSIIHDAVWEHQRVFVPAFAVGRTQLLMYELAALGQSGRVPSFPVYIDSPLASEATEVYMKHRGSLDADARAMFEYAEKPNSVPVYTFLEKAEDSRRLNDMSGAAVVIAGSGMCTGGRIVHHLKHNLWRRDARVMIVGYQPSGSIGRRLAEGAGVVRVLGDWVKVRAKIHTLGGFSAHAGQSELVAWASSWAKSRPRVLLNHGEDYARLALATRLSRDLGVRAETPGADAEYSL